MPFPYTVTVAIRFEGDFTLTLPAGAQANEPERELSGRIAEVLDRLASIVVDAEKLADRRLSAERKELAGSLQRLVQQVADDAVPPSQALFATYERWGQFSEVRSRIGRCTFYVQGLDAQSRIVAGRQGFEDILYQYGPGVPTADQIALKSSIDRALSVVRKVVPLSSIERGRDRSDYVRALVSIARAGLEFDQVPLANGELASFRQDFVTREASALKNSYVFRLGVWAVLLAGLTGLSFLAIDWYSDGALRLYRDPYGFISHFEPYLHRFQNLLLIAIGAAGGAWLAFLIRRPTLAFDDLTQLDEDLLTPGLRIVYTMLLSPLVGLLFWTGMLSVTIGKFDSNVAHSGLVCVIIGMLSGIASRGVATAVRQRADDFAATLGGTARPAP